MLFIVFAVAKGSDATAGEEERGTLDLLLANPLGRRRVVVQKSLAHGAALSVLAVVFWLAMAVGTGIFGIGLDRLRLAEVIFSLWLLGLVFYALALACGCWRGKKKFSIGVSGGLAVITYLVNAYAPMVESLRPFRVYRPFISTTATMSWATACSRPTCWCWPGSSLYFPPPPFSPSAAAICLS